jgi:hypothetical protein
VKLITPYSLLLGLIVTGPGLWAAFVDPSVAVAPAVLRFVVASLVAGAGIALVSGLVSAYAAGNRRAEALADGGPVTDGEKPSLEDGVVDEVLLAS